VGGAKLYSSPPIGRALRRSIWPDGQLSPRRLWAGQSRGQYAVENRHPQPVPFGNTVGDVARSSVYCGGAPGVMPAGVGAVSRLGLGSARRKVNPRDAPSGWMMVSSRTGDLPRRLSQARRKWQAGVGATIFPILLIQRPRCQSSPGAAHRLAAWSPGIARAQSQNRAVIRRYPPPQWAGEDDRFGPVGPVCHAAPRSLGQVAAFYNREGLRSVAPVAFR